MSGGPRRGPIPLPTGWRKVGRALAPGLYLLVLIVAAYLTVSVDLKPAASSSGTSFDHSYPSNPVGVERPKVVGAPPSVPSARQVSNGHLRTFAALAAPLPRQTLSPTSNGWLLRRSVEIEGRAVLDVHGGALRLAPGAFLISAQGGSIALTNVAVMGLGPAPSPSDPGHRGFLAAERGGRLILHRDRITDLGHPGVHTYGISFWDPAKGSGVWHSRIEGGYFGIYTTHAAGVTIAGNHVEDSQIYGIDPHTVSSHLRIVGNVIAHSGLHGIILADRVTSSLVKDNTVIDPTDHGIVVFDRSNDDSVVGNTIRGAFDGIVVDGSSHTTITGNTVSATRFGLRITGVSAATAASGNTVSDALVGAYVYAGPTSTTLRANSFHRTREPVRVRADALGTVVQPVPAGSEVAAPPPDQRHGLPWWLPLSLLGAFVWGSWLIRQVLGSRYRPRETTFSSATSVVVPVFREDVDVLRRCLETWTMNDVDEVLLVIDRTETELIPLAQTWAAHDERIRVIVVEHPGKRHALAVGIRAATSPIVLLTDSDTMWEDGFVAKVLCGFSEPTVGGVGCRQNVFRPGTSLWRRVADWMLDVRFIHQLPAAGRKDAIPCISGRTAAYRRDVIVPVLDELENETFFGRRCVSGDDGRLTWLILRDGWGTAFQGNARAWTVFPDTFKGFVDQRVRWSRNSYRCYARAIGRGWLFREPAITSVTVVQNLVGPFTLMIAVFFLARAVVDRAWLVAAVTAAWLMAGRAIKGIGHLVSEPASWLYVPLVTAVFIVVMIPVKVFSLLTLNKQGWITRLMDGGVAEGQGGAMSGG